MNIHTTSSKPLIDFAVAINTNEEKQTVIHVHCVDNEFGFLWIRIWPSTYLVQENGNRKKLIHSCKIGKYPDYLMVDSGHVFTLVFEGLDKDCKKFSLLEDIPEPGGFYIQNIERNKIDVYQLEIGE